MEEFVRLLLFMLKMISIKCALRNKRITTCNLIFFDMSLNCQLIGGLTEQLLYLTMKYMIQTHQIFGD